MTVHGASRQLVCSVSTQGGGSAGLGSGQTMADTQAIKAAASHARANPKISLSAKDSSAIYSASLSGQAALCPPMLERERGGR